ncbi:uncharacterized protein PAC_08579 [Phialocephala subalpina]|uniref:SH3 domain-containing protein n=1 Tax=Phialocephala subalpina TaxID=576137 RepID=A0A1L7X0Y0_9HELO|nr:uncharacterized protein PAC_08579 [Phialocephala subalpina]
MDPLSITASTVTLIQIASTVSGHQAPELTKPYSQQQRHFRLPGENPQVKFSFTDYVVCHQCKMQSDHMTMMTGDKCGVSSEQLPAKYDDLKRPRKSVRKRSNLALIIPTSSADQGGIPLIAHYPQRSTQSPIIETRDDAQAKGISPGLPKLSTSQISPVQGKTMAKVLYDFEGEGDNELTIEEDEIIHITCRASQGETGKPTCEGWLLAKKNRKYGLVPASYVAVKFPSSSPTGAITRTRKSIPKLEQAPKCLSERNLLPIYDGNPREKLDSNAAEDVEEEILPLQDLDQLSLECELGTDNLENLGGEQASESAALESINNRFSWCSKDSQQFTSTTGDQSQKLSPLASLRDSERDTEPKYQLVDDGVRDGLPVLHGSGPLREMRRPNHDSSSDSGSTSPKSDTQQDSVTHELSISQTESSLPKSQIQFLLDRFSSICRKDDPEKKIPCSTPKSTLTKMPLKFW